MVLWRLCAVLLRAFRDEMALRWQREYAFWRFVDHSLVRTTQRITAHRRRLPHLGTNIMELPEIRFGKGLPLAIYARRRAPVNTRLRSRSWHGHSNLPNTICAIVAFLSEEEVFLELQIGQLTFQV